MDWEDSGAALRTAFRALPWRELRNCPGRFTTRDRAARAVDPAGLVRRVLKVLEGVVSISWGVSRARSSSRTQVLSTQPRALSQKCRKNSDTRQYSANTTY